MTKKNFRFPEDYCFVATWEGCLQGIKGAIMNRHTGKIVPHKGQVMFFADPQRLQDAGIEILRGKKRKEFLDRFGLMIDSDTRVIRRKRR